jgi:hypothetical protein
MEDWSDYCQPVEKEVDAAEAQLQFLMDMSLDCQQMK